MLEQHPEVATETWTEVKGELRMMKTTCRNSKFLSLQGPFSERANSPSKGITVVWRTVILGVHKNLEFSRRCCV